MSERQVGPWKIKASKKIYDGKYFKVQEDQVVQPDGKPGAYGKITMSPGISVLPLDENDNVYLTCQFRYAVEHESLEVVTGSIDSTESSLEAAKRELKEEVGITAEDWTDLGEINPDTSIILGPMYLFLVRQLSFTELEPDGTEAIRVVKMPFSQAVEKVMRGEMTHGPSVATVLKAAQVLGVIQPLANKPGETPDDQSTPVE